MTCTPGALTVMARVLIWAVLPPRFRPMIACQCTPVASAIVQGGHRRSTTFRWESLLSSALVDREARPSLDADHRLAPRRDVEEPLDPPRPADELEGERQSVSIGSGRDGDRGYTGEARGCAEAGIAGPAPARRRRTRRHGRQEGVEAIEDRHERVAELRQRSLRGEELDRGPAEARLDERADLRRVLVAMLGERRLVVRGRLDLEDEPPGVDERAEVRTEPDLFDRGAPVGQAPDDLVE